MVSESPLVTSFDSDTPNRFSTRHKAVDNDHLCQSFVRCFSSDDGMRVLSHLRSMTRDRVLGPEASDAALRYIEGQRQLVAFVESQIARGRTDPTAFDNTTE